MKYNKIYYGLLVLLIIIMIFIANFTKREENLEVNINNDTKIDILKRDNVNIEEITKDDLIVKVRVNDLLERGNKCLILTAEIIDVLQGDFEEKSFKLYIDQQYQEDYEGNSILSVKSTSVILPNREYYLIIEPLEKKFNYMDESSYRLKDDFSIYNLNFDYNIYSTEQNLKVQDIGNMLYIIDDNKEEIISSRIEFIKEIIE